MPEEAIEVGIQAYLARLSLSNTKQYSERLGVKRSRTIIHNGVQKGRYTVLKSVFLRLDLRFQICLAT